MYTEGGLAGERKNYPLTQDTTEWVLFQGQRVCWHCGCMSVWSLVTGRYGHHSPMYVRPPMLGTFGEQCCPNNHCLCALMV